jgi:hypothetical protein
MYPYLLVGLGGGSKPIDLSQRPQPQGVFLVIEHDWHFIFIRGLPLNAQVTDSICAEAIHSYFNDLPTQKSSVLSHAGHSGTVKFTAAMYYGKVPGGHLTGDYIWQGVIDIEGDEENRPPSEGQPAPPRPPLPEWADQWGESLGWPKKLRRWPGNN